jgi:hypothetical protein
MTMFTTTTKVLVAALALAVTSLTFVATASAGPNQRGGYQGGGQTYQGQDAYMAICRSRFCS